MLFLTTFSFAAPTPNLISFMGFFIVVVVENFGKSYLALPTPFINLEEI